MVMSSRTKQQEEKFQQLLADASKLPSAKKRELALRLGVASSDPLARRAALTAVQPDAAGGGGDARHHSTLTGSHSDFSRVMHMLPVEPAQTSKQQRRVGHVLFSRRAFDRYLDFTATRYFWVCLALGTIHDLAVLVVVRVVGFGVRGGATNKTPAQQAHETIAPLGGP